MSITVDHHIPIPTNTGKGAHRKFPLPDMRPGDSIHIPRKDAINARSAIQYFKMRNPGVGFTTRTEGDGIRVWRIA